MSALPALLAALLPGLLPAAGTITAGLIGGSAQNSATAANVDLANKANAVSNAQWGAEFGENKKQFRETMNYKAKTDLESMLNTYPKLKKDLVSIWSGGK
jgi:hypothetical protein